MSKDQGHILDAIYYVGCYYLRHKQKNFYRDEVDPDFLKRGPATFLVQIRHDQKKSPSIFNSSQISVSMFPDH